MILLQQILHLSCYNRIDDKRKNNNQIKKWTKKYLRERDIYTHVKLKRTSCYKSANKLLQICSQDVDKLCSHCLEKGLEKAVNNSQQAWCHYQICYKVVPTSLIQSRYNKKVTRFTTQGCNSIVISWLYRTYWNNLATTLIMPSSLLQVVNSSFQTCWQLGTSAVNTTCWWLAGRLATRCEILTQSIDKTTYHIIWISQENIVASQSTHFSLFPTEYAV